MERIYKIVDEKKGIAQITTDNERWYVREVEDQKTKEKSFVYLPSCTWISSFYPKGIAYYKWIADKGWDEAEAIKEDRGKHGSKVHKTVELLLAGAEVKMNEEVMNPRLGILEQLTVEEYGAVISFVEWYKTLKNPEIVESEQTIWNEKDGFAGTLDLLLKIDGELWLIDLKTSQSIWPSHEIQISAYAHSIPEKVKLGILQLGYKRNKNNYKFTEIEDKYDLFLASRKIWINECETMKPFERDYPLSISLGVPANRTKGVRPIKDIKKKLKLKKKV